MEDLKDKEEIKKYEKIIKDYLFKNKNIYLIKDIKDISITFKNLGGGMNKNYLIKIENKENNKTKKIFFRYFGDLISSYFDRKREAQIIKILGENGYGPKLLEYDYKNEKYRIDEFIDDSIELTHDKLFNENILKDLIIILNKYSQLSDIYKYELIKENNTNNFNLVQEGNIKQLIITKNIYTNTINNIYHRATKNFEKFNDDYLKSSYQDDNLNENNINKIKNLINNFISLFSSFFNKKGYFILNHSDLYQSNILLNKNTNKIYLIDNEFACLNMIGFDIVWYSLMSIIQYYPKYEYYPELMDYDKFYEIFKKYLECFIETNTKWINENNERKNYIESLKKEKYFCELLCICNLFAFIIGLIDLQFKEEFIDKSIPPFFVCVLNRIKIFEYSYKKYQNFI
jgi:hypothetical protein